MLTDRWSIRVVPLFAILLMGLLAMALVLVADNLHRRETLKREQQYTQELLESSVKKTFQQLEYRSQELVTALLGNDIDYTDPKAVAGYANLKSKLSEAQRHYLVKSRRLSVVNINALDAGYTVLTQLDNAVNIKPCQSLISTPDSNNFSGYEASSGLCDAYGQILYVTTVSFGRHVPELYIQVAIDPIKQLKQLPMDLGMPAEILKHDGTPVWKSTAWPKEIASKSAIIRTQRDVAPSGKPLVMAVLKDMAPYHARLEKTSYTIVMVAAAVALLTILITLSILQRTAVEPLQRLAMHVRKLSQSGSRLGKAVTISGNSEVAELSGNINEMTSRLSSMYDSLEQLAFKDALTSLPNRSLFRDRLEQAILTSTERKNQFALMILDLDRFKEINDALGHHMGDQVLQQVSARLKAQMGIGDTIGRLGGDEFAVLLQGYNLPAAIKMAKALQEALKGSFKVDDHNFYLGASIGIAMFPEHGKAVSVLMQHADVAMYVAKHNKSGHCIYNPELDKHNPEKLALAGDLNRALYKQQFFLFYQPKLNLGTNTIDSVEALVRWEHDEKGMVPPDVFIPMLEQTGQVTELTHWVIEQSLSQARDWRDAGTLLTVAVNLSVRDLQITDAVTRIFDLLAKYHVPSLSLDLEITENSVMTDPVVALETLGHLSAAGLNVSIDDFGTGYSSLSYLKKFPAKTIKIDKSFVIGMDKDKNDYAIVRASIGLAHHMGLKVVAEGVENENVLESLRAMGCDYVQGYHIAKPMPLNELEEWMRQARWATARAGN